MAEQSNQRFKAETAPSLNKKSNVCRYFSQYKFCKFGMDCKFVHLQSPHSLPRNYVFQNNVHRREHYSFHYRNQSFYRNSNVRLKQPIKDKRQICWFFQRGHCNEGEYCRFSHSSEYSTHPNESNTLLNDHKLIESSEKTFDNSCQDKSSELPIIEPNNSCLILNNSTERCDSSKPKTLLGEIKSSTASVKPPVRSILRQQNLLFDVMLMNEEKCNELRNTEIVQLRKRFPSAQVIKVNNTYEFSFQPSDPDWPYDVKIFIMHISFPECYPFEVCKIQIVEIINKFSNVILSDLNERIFAWLNDRHATFFASQKVELAVRPFLKWFDKSIMELYGEAIKKTQKNIIDVSSCPNESTSDATSSILTECNYIYVKEKSSNDSWTLSSSQNKTPNSDITSGLQNLSLSQNSIEKQGVSPLEKKKPDNHKKDPTVDLGQKLDIEILSLGLEFVEGVAAMRCSKVSLTLICARCKTQFCIQISQNAKHSVCSKCSRVMQCFYIPSFLHLNSNVMGTLTLVEAQAVDVNLVECDFYVSCLNCNQDVPAKGLHYGPKQNMWCKFCNQKQVISIQSCKFQVSKSSLTKVQTASAKKQEKKKDPLIKEGCPLPNTGTCKHYKKSHRWLRFPCCGRIYPCDICHEEKESDHEMKFASRMICGFCSKEQPYSKDKPCTGCSGTVVPKAGSHWEGGQGCRNKTKMCRVDKQKYSGSCKTVSKKAQNSGKKKK